MFLFILAKVVDMYTLSINILNKYIEVSGCLLDNFRASGVAFGYSSLCVFISNWYCYLRICLLLFKISKASGMCS